MPYARLVHWHGYSLECDLCGGGSLDLDESVHNDGGATKALAAAALREHNADPFHRDLVARKRKGEEVTYGDAY